MAKDWLKEQVKWAAENTKDWPDWKKDCMGKTSETRYTFNTYPKYRGVNHMLEFINSWK